jgi:glutamate synthase (NADPH/NADH) small chain
MPGSAREVANAEEEGVDFQWLTNPKEFIGKNGQVTEVVLNKMKLGEADATGRQTPEIIQGSEIKIKADMVIKALGFDPEDIPSLFSEPKLDVSKWGTIKIDLKTMQTNLDGIFAAGDIVRGASLVVWAIKDGRDAAEAMDIYLKNKISKSLKKRMVA